VAPDSHEKAAAETDPTDETDMTDEERWRLGGEVALIGAARGSKGALCVVIGGRGWGSSPAAHKICGPMGHLGPMRPRAPELAGQMADGCPIFFTAADLITANGSQNWLYRSPGSRWSLVARSPAHC
jgi:hypothetical protein